MSSIHLRRLDSRKSRTAQRLVDYARREGLDVADLADAQLPWYQVRDQSVGASDAGTATVFIFDEIGGSFGVSAKRFVAELEAITAPVIRVRINSPGGSVFDAIAIYNGLRHHPAHIEVYVDSLAASAASVIAMAGDEIVMMPGSQMMIHDASMVEDGGPDDMAKASTFLHRQSDNIADIYQLRGGGEAAQWRELMRAETWMFAREAVEAGLADRTEAGMSAQPDPQIQERMTRSFDLGQYRYAGREHAPPPGRAQPPRVVVRSVGVPGRVQVRETPDESLRAAGERREAAAKAGGAFLAPPCGQARTVSTEWMVRGRTARADTAVLPPRLKVSKSERDGKQFFVVEGYYTVYERGYEMWDEHGPYTEIVTVGAGDKTTTAGPDVIFLTNHRGLAMARTTAGTLELWSDEVGGGNRAWLNPHRQDVRDLVLGIDDKTVTEQSFAFMIEAGRWNTNLTEYRINIYDLDRGDTSAVNYGANPHTSIAARAREILDELEHLPVAAARAALDRLNHRTDLELARSAAPAVSKAAPETDGGGRSLTQLDAWLATVGAGK